MEETLPFTTLGLKKNFATAVKIAEPFAVFFVMEMTP